jgi:hypothetical protein
MPPRVSNVVSYTIEHCLTKVRLKGSLVTRLEILNSPCDVRERLLDEVVCIERIAGPAGQTAVRPFLQPGQVERAQIVECALVTFTSALYERERRLGLIQRSPSWRMILDAGLYLTGGAVALV